MRLVVPGMPTVGSKLEHAFSRSQRASEALGYRFAAVGHRNASAMTTATTMSAIMMTHSLTIGSASIAPR